MQILLDTHVFLWFALNDKRLFKEYLNRIKDFRNEIYLSIASLWEIAIKSGLGKLSLDASFVDFVESNVFGEGIMLLDVNVEHLTEVQKLPHHHRDPFDRLIIAQGIVEKLAILTTDPQFKHYNIDLI